MVLSLSSTAKYSEQTTQGTPRQIAAETSDLQKMSSGAWPPVFSSPKRSPSIVKTVYRTLMMRISAMLHRMKVKKVKSLALRIWYMSLLLMTIISTDRTRKATVYGNAAAWPMRNHELSRKGRQTIIKIKENRAVETTVIVS